MTNSLETIALEIAEEINGCPPHYPNDVIYFAKALIERLTRDAEPVVWANEHDLVKFAMRVRTNTDLMHTVPLFLHPQLTQQVPEEAYQLLSEIVAEAEDYEQRTGGKVKGWLDRAKAMLAAAPKEKSCNQR